MRKFIKNKRAVSPLVATILLIVFSLILGTVTMNLGKTYIEDIATLSPSKEIGADTKLKYIGNSLYQCINVNRYNKKCMNWELVK